MATGSSPAPVRHCALTASIGSYRPPGFGRYRGLRRCTHCRRDNHTVDRCWDIYGRPVAHQVSAFENDTVTIPVAEYQRLLATQSSATATLAPISASAACISTHTSWVIDSGASAHMTGTPSVLTDMSSSAHPSRVTLADGSTSRIDGLGNASLSSSISLQSVLYVPKLPFNLLSVSNLTKSLNCSVTFFPSHCVFQDLQTGKRIGGGTARSGLYYFNADTPSSMALRSTIDPHQLHCRLGHPSLPNLKKLAPSCQSLQSLPCEVCELSKHTRVSYPSRVERRASSPFHLVHSDIWGPIRVPSYLGFHYFVIFVDDFSRVTYLYLMKDRSELRSIFTSFYNEV